MNGRQRKAWAVGTLLFLLAGLFPPWVERNPTHVYGSWVEVRTPRGLSFLLAAPKPRSSFASVRVDWSRLAVVLLLVGTATGSALVLLADRQGER